MSAMVVLCMIAAEVAVTTTCEVPVGVDAGSGTSPHPTIAPSDTNIIPAKSNNRSGLELPMTFRRRKARSDANGKRTANVTPPVR